MIYVEETLTSGAIPAVLKPNLVYGEIMFGSRRPLAFLQAVREDSSLIGVDSTAIQIEVDSQLSATSASESTIDASGYTAVEPSVTNVAVTIGNEVYSAFRLSKTLMEDKPSVDWVRNTLRNAGLAVMEYLDSAIRDCLIAGAYTTYPMAAGGTTTYADLTGAVQGMKSLHWYPEEGNPFMCFLANQPVGDIMGSTTFVSSERYTAGSLDKIVDGEVGKIAGMKVLETSNWSQSGSGPYLGLVVAPPTHKFGPSTILAWKRKMDVASRAYEDFARTVYIVSARYGMGVVNSKAITLLSNC